MADILSALLRKQAAAPEAVAKRAGGMLSGLSGDPGDVSGFVTKRAGSKYVVLPGGATQRLKAASEYHPDHQDAGLKAPSASTFYLTPEAAARASSAYAQGRSSFSGQKLVRLRLQDGKPVLEMMQFERLPPEEGSGLPGTPVREIGYRSYPLPHSTAPSVGLSPLEFFDDGFHLGSEISEITGQ